MVNSRFVSDAINIPCLICSKSCTEILHHKILKNGVRRDFIRCTNCEFIFVPPAQHIPLLEQKKFYNHHQNSPEQTGYIEHLKSLARPMLPYLKPTDRGLDYGSGPGPTLHTIFAKEKITVQNYDPLYAPDQNLLSYEYDFVVSTEVVEHFTAPRSDWQTLHHLLKPSGTLGIMTQFQPTPLSPKTFADWWYHRDVTHIGFYTPKTFEWLAKNLGFEVLLCENPIVIFKKSEKNPQL